MTRSNITHPAQFAGSLRPTGYEAPVILSEAAFEFVLAGVLVKKAKEIDNPDWIGSVFKNTWKPFLCTVVLAIISSSVVSHFFPEAIKLSQVFTPWL